MKKRIGRFLFDLIVGIVNKLDDETYDRFMARVHRPEFARKIPLPTVVGQTISFPYTPISKDAR